MITPVAVTGCIIVTAPRSKLHSICSPATVAGVRTDSRGFSPVRCTLKPYIDQSMFAAEPGGRTNVNRASGMSRALIYSLLIVPRFNQIEIVTSSPNLPCGLWLVPTHTRRVVVVDVQRAIPEDFHAASPVDGSGAHSFLGRRSRFAFTRRRLRGLAPRLLKS